ncbi:hypothetical protein D920_00385 [Enterococcus faecalis 13-SD-W-01]|nr:hypothetical protein D920_00385 [Enterococcus faecalis 13-SD-W-01]
MQFSNLIIILFAYLFFYLLGKIPGKMGSFVRVMIHFVLIVLALFLLFYTGNQVLQFGIKNFEEFLTYLIIVVIMLVGIFYSSKKIYLTIINL